MGKRRQKKLPKFLSRKQLRDFLGVFNKKSNTGFRDLLFFKIAVATGMRCQEILDMRYDLLMEVDGDYLYLLETSKSGEGANIPIPKEILDDIYKLSTRFKHYRKGYVFTSVNGNRLNSRYLRRKANEKGVEAGIPFPVTPHTMRHTAATLLYNDAGDILLVQEFLRHSSIDNTMIYTKMLPRRTINVVNRLQLYK